MYLHKYVVHALNTVFQLIQLKMTSTLGTPKPKQWVKNFNVEWKCTELQTNIGYLHYVGLEEVEELQADNGLDRTGKEYDFVEVKVRNNIKVNQFKSWWLQRYDVKELW